MNSQVFVRSLASRDRFMSQRRVYWTEKVEEKRQLSAVCSHLAMILKETSQLIFGGNFN